MQSFAKELETNSMKQMSVYEAAQPHRENIIAERRKTINENANVAALNPFRDW